MSEQEQDEVLSSETLEAGGILSAPFGAAELLEEAMDTLENFAATDPAFGQSETCDVLRVYLLSYAFGIIGDFGKRRDEAMLALRTVLSDPLHAIRNAEHWRAQIAFLDAHVASATRVIRKSRYAAVWPAGGVGHDQEHLQ